MCLRSFDLENFEPRSVEIIVVDNNSSDNTKEIVTSFADILPLVYLSESILGLSYARNKGFEESSGNWVGYIDDDVILPKRFLLDILSNLSDGPDYFGCRIISEYLFLPKPKWLSKDFESNYNNNRGEIWGGAMFFKRSIIPIKPFSTELGMKGRTLGYGEESYLIKYLESKNYKSTFYKDVVVKHIVNKDKYMMSWHWRSSFQKGLTDAKVGLYLEKDLNKIRLKIILYSVLNIPLVIKNIMFSEGYYFQNGIIDYLSNLYYYKGVLKQLTNE